MSKILYETVITDNFIEKSNFICLDLVDIDKLDKSETYHCFVSHQTRKKLEKENIDFSFSDSPSQFTTEFLISHFNELTLTGDMVLVPFGAILNGLTTDEIFIRPNTGFKIFPGQTLKINELDLFKKTYNIPNDVLCGRSSTVGIVSEKRTFLNVVDKKLITQSLYCHNGEDAIIDFNVSDIINVLFEKDEICLLPDIVVADFALLDTGDIRLVEFNSLITSGHYSCNIIDIIKHIENIS